MEKVLRFSRGGRERRRTWAARPAWPNALTGPASREWCAPMHRYRTHTCGALRESDSARPFAFPAGAIAFAIMAASCSSICAITTALPNAWPTRICPAFEAAETLRAEWVVRIDGRVRKRPAGTENPDMPTGPVEVYVTEIEVFGPAAELPMPVFGEQNYPEDMRLRYRFLDLRREKLHQNIMLRGQIIDSLARRMKAQGFFEFQTPILTASSPEGARDFLVPSRLHPGKFYALPQAPQQFKQLIMVAGFDRYFQIAPCFRDEDARADRTPGRILPARYRDELCHAGGCVCTRSSRCCAACSRNSPAASR